MVQFRKLLIMTLLKMFIMFILSCLQSLEQFFNIQILELMKALVHERKILALVLVKQTQNFA